MRVVISGAAGYLGLSVVRAAARRGHTVVGLVRSEAQGADVRRAGGSPLVGDVLVPESFQRALGEANAVVHLAQPSNGDLGRMRAVRVEGGRNLALAIGDRTDVRFVVGSGYWVYASSPEGITEESPLDPRSISKVNFDTEREVARTLGARQPPPIIVRPGMVYGKGSWFASMVEELRSGEYRYIDDGANYLSPVHLDDVGEAFATILERGLPGSTFLVVDDTPVRTSDFAEFVARQIGAPRPRSMPLEEAKRSWGEDLALLNAASRRASNERLRSLGWMARWSSYEEGVPPVLREFARETTA
jgi:nucleoside-diphosphate-sugar epimerase